MALPEKLKQPRLRDYRNNDQGGAIPATAAGLAGGATAATIMGALGITLAANPITAPIAVVVAGLLAASPWMYNKAKQWSINNKIDESEKALNKLSQSPNANDPKVQEQINYHRNRLGKYGVQTSGGQNGQPVQIAGLPQQAGGAPQGNWLTGTPAYNEQVPLFTPEQQAYQNETIQQLRQNPADFGAIRNEELRRFKEETAPQLAEQYFGANANNEFSSAYPEALGRGGASLGSRLASLQSQFEAERESRRQQVAIQPSFAPVQHGREPGFAETALDRFGEKGIEYLGKNAGRFLGLGGDNASSSAQQQSAQQTSQAATQINPVNTAAYQQPAQLSAFKGPYAPSVYAKPGGVDQLLMKQAELANNRLGGRTR